MTLSNKIPPLYRNLHTSTQHETKPDSCGTYIRRIRFRLHTFFFLPVNHILSYFLSHNSLTPTSHPIPISLEPGQSALIPWRSNFFLQTAFPGVPYSLLIFVLIPYANISLTNAIDINRYPINILSVLSSWHVLALLLLLENVLGWRLCVHG